MFHNLKADIIYYKTATDFELEFNLCGCCRMRLLSDKMQDKKSFVHSLARAVSRSRVILIAGPLFGEDGTIKTVVDAINTTTEIADSSAYGILGDEQIEIIKGSIPLVTPDGYFGGCIIESGPQSMILLTENKNIRKTIMKNLIHPYFEDLYSAETTKPTIEEFDNNEIIIDTATEEAPEENNEEIALESTENAEDFEIIIDSQETEEIEETETEHQENIDDFENNIIINDDYVLSDNDQDEEDAEDDYETIDLVFEPSKSDHQTVKLPANQYLENPGFYEEDAEIYYETEKPRKSSLSLSVFIISLVLLIVIVVLCYCIFLVPAKTGISPVANLQEIFNTMFG